MTTKTPAARHTHPATIFRRRCDCPYDQRPTPGEPDGQCPVCAVEEIYHRGLDRYFHTDGTDNRTCWAAISRGEVTVA